jgi:hypothetical protein
MQCLETVVSAGKDKPIRVDPDESSIVEKSLRIYYYDLEQGQGDSINDNDHQNGMNNFYLVRCPAQ